MTNLQTNTTAQNFPSGAIIPSFTSTGYNLAAAYGLNYSTSQYVSWTFRKAPKFFDVVTYTGDGSLQRTLTHSLASVPGVVIVKATSTTGNWLVKHRSLSYASSLAINSTGSVSSGFQTIEEFTSATFDVFNYTSGLGSANENGIQYVAYLFAHDATADGLIQCGSFTTDASGNASVTSLGWEPQFLMVKAASTTGDWIMLDTMRGWSIVNAIEINRDAALSANVNSVETAATNYGNPTATGFDFQGGAASVTYIYMAIRRGPMKTPTSGDIVFYPNAVPQAETVNSSGVPFPPDLVTTFSRNGTYRFTYSLFQFFDRLRGLAIAKNGWQGSHAQALYSSEASGEQANSSYVHLSGDGRNIERGNGWNSTSYGNHIYYFFRRAPGFMDVVCYTGDAGAGRAIAHNLGVKPELIITKNRSGGSPSVTDWIVSALAADLNFGGTTFSYIAKLNTTDAFFSNNAYFTNTAPTSTQFSVTTHRNYSGTNFVAYLFASVPGVSKIGTYTGNDSVQTINCGFSAGARFVLMKAISTTSSWMVWDTARGISSENDPMISLELSNAETNGANQILPHASGFTVQYSGPDLNRAPNRAGVTYLYLAIA
jgi:hypothetical protein